MQYLITRIAQILICIFCAQIIEESQALLVAIPLLTICVDIALKLWTGRGLLFHLFNA